MAEDRRQKTEDRGQKSCRGNAACLYKQSHPAAHDTLSSVFRFSSSKRGAATKPLSSVLCPPSSERGFTLIELLVALVILALLSVAGYRGLDAVLQSRERVAVETRKWQHLSFFFARLNQDLAQVVPRPVRDEDGLKYRAALVGTAVTVGENDAELTFSRAGIPDQGAAMLTPQRVAYKLEQDTIVQLRWPALDQATRVKPLRYPVLEGVRDFKLRYLDGQRIWQLQWPAPTNPSLEDKPKAIEVALTLVNGEVITRVFALQ